MRRFLKLSLILCLIIAASLLVFVGCNDDGGQDTILVDIPDDFQTEYVQGETFDFNRISVKVNGETLTSGYTVEKISERKFKEDIRYSEAVYSVKMDGAYIGKKIRIKIYEKILSLSVYLESQAKTTFYVDDEIDYSGWYLKLNYYDGYGLVPFEEEMITNEVSSETSGQKPVSVSFRNVKTDNVATILVQKYDSEDPQIEILECGTNYVKLAGKEGVSYSLDGENWQTSPQFTDLEIGTQYTVYAAVLEDRKTNPSKIVSETFTTDKNTVAPPYLEAYGITSDSFKVLKQEGVDVWADNAQRTDAGAYWLFSNLQAYTEYKLYAMVLETSTNHPSSVTQITVTTSKITDSIITEPVQVFDYTKSAKVPAFSMKSGTSFSSDKFDIKYKKDGTVFSSAIDAGEYTVTISFKDPKYDIEPQEIKLIINKRSITVTADDKNTVYGDKEKALTFSVTSDLQMAYGDKLSGRMERESGTNAGEYAITKGTLDNSNYDITFVGATYYIAKKDVTVTADNVSKVYGEQDKDLTYRIFGLIGTDKLSGSLIREKGENVGKYAISGSFENVNYNVIVTEATFTIVPSGNITFSIENLTVTYDGKTHGIVAQSEATVDFTYLYNGKNAEPVNAGTYSVEVSATGKGNYTGTKVKTCTLTINKKEATVTADNASKGYSDNNPEFSYTISGNVAGDQFGTADYYTAATKYSNVGAYSIIVSGLKNDNYNITYVEGTLTISKKAITVTADSKTKVYGDNDPELTYSVDGASIGEIPGSLSRSAGENVGEYDITIGSLINDNFEITFNKATLTINKAPLSIKVNNAEREIGSDNPVFTSSMTGLKLNDSVEINYVCSADKDSPVGTYEISATASDDNYEIAITFGTLTVNRLTNFVVDVSNVSVTYDGQEHGIIAVSAATVTFTYYYNDKTEEPVNAGVYEVKIVAVGTGDYEGEKTLFRTLTILPRSITVTANNASSVYGEEEAQLTYSYDADLLGNEFSGNIAREGGKNAGEYNIVAGTLALSNHEITFVNGKYTIEKRSITVKADNKQRIYGNNNPEFTYSVTEGTLVNDDILGLCTFTVSATRTSNVGNYEIGTSGITNGNYDIDYESGVLSIVPREVTLSAGDNVFTYSGSEIVPDVALLNIANNDNVAIGFDKDAVDAGEYTLTASISDTNYSLVGNTSFEVVINKAQQSISIESTVFPYTGKVHSIVATLVSGDGDISYENNSNTNVGEYEVTVKVSGTQNYLELNETVNISITKTEITIEDIALSDITYGDKLSVSVITGIAKLIDLVAEGVFSFINGDEILHAGTHEVEVLFTPEDSNIDAKSVFVGITVLRKTVNVTVEDGGKGIGNEDPAIVYSVTGVLDGDTYEPSVSRVSGEAVGEYGYTVQDSGEGDYAPQIISSTKFYILDKLVEFSGYSDEFIYRVGVTNGYSMQLSFKEGYDISSLEVTFSTVVGTASGSYKSEKVTFSGSGKVKIGLKIKNTYNVIFDEKVFEVVANAVNVTSFSQIKSNLDSCLHNDLILTNDISVSAGVTLHGNGHTIDGSAWLPNSNYLSLITLYGTLDNVKVRGPYAYDGFNQGDETNYYRTTQVVYMYGSARILNSHIEGSRYAVRIGDINDALIENSTLKNGTQTIFIKPSNGGTNSVLTLRNVNIVDKPEGDHYPGLGIYFEAVPCKDFTLRLEGTINFHCMYTQSDIKRMPTSYQAILTTLWNDSSMSNIKHTVDGTTYLNAAIVHLMSDNNQFILDIDENCNCYNKLTRVQKSVSVLGSTYQGAGYTFDKNKVTTNEMKALLTEPESKVNHTYSPVAIKTAGTYKTEIKAVVETGMYYTLDNSGVRFVKYGEDMNFEIASIQQLTSAFGRYELLENGAKFYLGQYLVTYRVEDVYDGGYQYFTTKVIITDTSPAPVIVFTYANGKGSGTSADPFLWIGQITGTIFDPDYTRNLDLFFGVSAFDSNGNSIPRENFTITINGTVFSNTSEAVFSYTSNNEENTVYAVKYTVTDVQGKTTTATRYIKMNSYTKRPDNGTAPSVTRSVAGYGDLHNVNIGEINIKSAGTLVACDGKNSYVFAATGATKYVFDVSGAVVQP